MNAIVQRPQAARAPTASGLIPQNMDQAMRLAEMMARGKLVPQHFQGQPGDCLMVIEQAMRWNMSPFAVAQCASSIKGKLMFEGKLVAAAIESSGALDGYFDYQFSGEGLTRQIVVSAKRRGETTPKTVEVVLKDVQTENGMWKKQPDQQLVYHGARVWGRRWTPGVMLGVYSPEEFSQGVVPDDFAGTTIDASAEPAGTREAINAAVPLADAPKRPSVAEWLNALQIDLEAAQTSDAVDAILARDDVQKAQDALRNGAAERLNAMIKEALDRTGDGWPGPETTDPAA